MCVFVNTEARVECEECGSQSSLQKTAATVRLFALESYNICLNM